MGLLASASACVLAPASALAQALPSTVQGPAVAAPATGLSPAQSGVARRILVQGNERIESATVQSYLPIAPGDVVDPARIDLALKTLFRTDLFADVRIELIGEDLVVNVVENPIINQVVFEGNSALNDEKLRNEVTIHPRGIFTRSHVQQDVQRIVELYRRSGRISASVTPEIVELPQKRVDLIFRIQEGPKTGIDRVNFIGNRAYSDNTLKDTIVTSESHWYKFFGSNDNYDPDRIEYDREQLRKYYTNKGYYDFRVVSSIAELTPDQRDFAVTYTIDEGPKYRFGKLTVNTDLRRLNADVLRQLLPIKEGQTYQGDKIEAAVDALTFSAGASGFAFVDIRPRYTPNRENNTVDVTFDIREGPRVYIERIDIIGNTRTIDPVVRQQLRLAEGDAYNRVLVDRSKLEVRRLGFFKTVDIDQLPGSAPDRTVLQVKVEEQPTGELSFGAGYSSFDKLMLDVGVSEHNFRGRGQDVRLRASVGSLRQQIDFSFTEPRFLGRDLRAGVDLFSYKYDYSNQTGFLTNTIGGGTRLGFPMNTTTYLSLNYTVRSDKVEVPNASCDVGAISVALCSQRGTNLTSLLGYSLSLDRRNDPIRPTRGYYATFSQGFAGFGGNVRYLRTDVQGAWYYGLTSTLIFQVIGSGGYINGWGGDSVRINDRYYKGGQTFRGFEIAGIGPRDTLYGESIGGKLFGIGTVELAFPNKLPEQYGIKTSLFLDAGTLGLVDRNSRTPSVRDNLALRASTGLSVFWTSPMGPIRLDFSKILAKTDYDRTETFRFSTATQF
jgi:outer membrane protein insertion porin family